MTAALARKEADAAWSAYVTATVGGKDAREAYRRAREADDRATRLERTQKPRVPA